MLRSRFAFAVALTSVAACGSPPPTTDGALDDAATPRPDAAVVCETIPTIELGDPTGHADPLGAGPTEARAGRIDAASLPDFPSGLQRWGSGEFILANDRVAVAIEDAGPSDLYDPWGGRITGIARVEGGALVEPADLAEFFVLTGRFTVVTDHVTVMNDGSDGQPAVVRASGALRPLPFFEAITEGVLAGDYSDIPAAIDYSLAPGSSEVQIHMVYASPRGLMTRVPLILHGFMNTYRMQPFVESAGFDHAVPSIDWLGFADDRYTSFIYEIDGALGTVIAESGFLGRVALTRNIPPCATTSILHARLSIGGPGLDGALVARAEGRGETLREITGVAREPDGSPAESVRVHALSSAGDWLTRSDFTGPDGAFSLHVPAEASVRLDPYRLGNGRATIVDVPAGASTMDVTLPPSGFITLTATDDLGDALPVRMQVLTLGAVVEEPPSRYGEEDVPDGRVGVTYTETGIATLRVPVGAYRVIASRGYEYELGDVPSVSVTTSGETVMVSTMLTRSVETPLVMCGDFHIHTRRSADAIDDGLLKVRAAVAEGLEIPVRSDHEYVNDFQPEIAALGMEAFAHGICSVEMTSMQLWGHMGVFPLVEDDSQINGGTPPWQTYPTPGAMDTPFRTMGPAEVFDMVRARPEAPVVIINHPMGAMSLLCFVREGHSQAADGPHKKTLTTGFEWLVAHQEPTGRFVAEGSDSTMYSHAFAAWALCEAFRATGDEKLQAPAQRAVEFIEFAQDPKGGGWRYQPKMVGDLSVTAWQVYALESTRAGKLVVQDATWDGARRYLDSVRHADRGDFYSYVAESGVSPSMTAHGLSCRLILDLDLDRQAPAFTAGVSYLQSLLPDPRLRNCYTELPFATVMAKVKGDTALEANRKLARQLIETQEQAGCAAGSWHPREPVADPWAENGGRIMVTSFSLLTLQACRP